MLQAWKDLFKSKKFWLTITGTVVVTTMSAMNMPNDLITMVAGFFGVNIAGQAAADFGKSAKQ